MPSTRHLPIQQQQKGLKNPILYKNRNTPPIEKEGVDELSNSLFQAALSTLSLYKIVII